MAEKQDLPRHSRVHRLAQLQRRSDVHCGPHHLFLELIDTLQVRQERVYRRRRSSPLQYQGIVERPEEVGDNVETGNDGCPADRLGENAGVRDLLVVYLCR